MFFCIQICNAEEPYKHYGSCEKTIILQVQKVDNNDTKKSVPFSLKPNPTVQLIGQSLLLNGQFQNLTLSLIRNDNDVIFTTFVTQGTDEVILPVNGEYTLVLNDGNYMYFADVLID